MNVTKDIRYIGVNDHEIDLFEGMYIVPEGMAYNSYVILDEVPVSRIHHSHLLVQNDIGIVSHAFRHDIHSFKQVDLMIIDPDIPDIIRNVRHNLPPVCPSLLLGRYPVPRVSSCSPGVILSEAKDLLRKYTLFYHPIMLFATRTFPVFLL